MSSLTNLNDDKNIFATIKFQPNFEVRSDNQYHVNNFLSLYDRNFIEASYLAILKRKPDTEGEKYYLNRIRSGSSKAKILAQIKNSKEAALHKVKITGLQSILFIEGVCGIPVIGNLFQLIIFIVSINAYQRDMRILENHIFRVMEEMHILHRKELVDIKTKLEQGK